MKNQKLRLFAYLLITDFLHCVPDILVSIDPVLYVIERTLLIAHFMDGIYFKFIQTLLPASPSDIGHDLFFYEEDLHQYSGRISVRSGT